MLKRIGRHQVRLGMYIERIEGEWLDHPFWRSSFLLQDAADLERLRRSDAAFVVIDESRGVPARADAAVRPGAAPAPQARVLRPATIHADEAIGQYRKAAGQIFADARSGRLVNPARSSRVVEEIGHALGDNLEAVVKLTRLKSIDGYTYLHSVAVSAFMLGFGRHLGLGEAEVHELGIGGLMHDIGKVALAPHILTKSTPLTDEEMEAVRAHPRRGLEIVERSGFSQTVCDITLHHHEKVDGTGYPDGLAGTDISPAARIAAICDVYDAVTSLRPYKKAWTAVDALGQMTRWEGHFDRGLLAEFVIFLGYRDVALGGPTAPVEEVMTYPFLVNGFSDPVGALPQDTRRRAGA